MEKQQTEEVWKTIPGFPKYEVSNKGNVMSYVRKAPRLMKFHTDKNGYKKVGIVGEEKTKAFAVHQLVAMAFLNHVPNGITIVVDHINNISSDNRLENLQLISNRENNSKDKKGYSSKYVGVHWNAKSKRWRARIRINGVKIHIGQYKDEELAHKAYQKALKEHNNSIL